MQGSSRGRRGIWQYCIGPDVFGRCDLAALVQPHLQSLFVGLFVQGAGLSPCRKWWASSGAAMGLGALAAVGMS